MTHSVGLDVAVKSTKVCVVDRKGAVVLEGEVETEPRAIEGFLRGDGRRYKRVLLELTPMCQWLYKALAARGFPVVCVEAQHASAVLRTRLNKTDRNDAAGLAELGRLGHFKAVHIKTDPSLEVRALLTARRTVLAKQVDVEASMRGLLHTFGIKVGRSRRRHFAEETLTLLDGLPGLARIIRPMLEVRQALATCVAEHDRLLQAAARADLVCRRLMTAPGVGPQVALTYRAGVDIPERFPSSRDVAAHFGLTPRTRQTGSMEYRTRISRCGDADVRRALYFAARAMMAPGRRDCALRRWGLAVKERAGGNKAIIAVARRLAVILHRMWVTETDFRMEPAGG